MKVWIRTPFSQTKNLGAEYNAEMALIPDGDAACFIDGDVCFLTPDFGTILHTYANEYPHNVLTCYTNRIHALSVGQTCNHFSNNIEECIRIAEMYRDNEQGVCSIQDPVSGFLLVVPKSIWLKHKFVESNQYRPGEPNLLGVDNMFTNQVRAAGVEVLRMNRLLVWHSYRLLDGSKKHLL